MKSLHAGGYLFVGGAILLSRGGLLSTIVGFLCTLLGIGILLYFLFGEDKMD